MSCEIVTTPADLQELLVKSAYIKRYIHEDYPPIFDDNVRGHTGRCVEIACAFDLPESIRREPLIRTVWIHDLVELETGDVVAIHKKDEEIDEIAAARRMFNDDDLRLFVDFVNASKFLNGDEIELRYVTPEAIVAKVIDLIEGNITFHRSIAEWALTGEYNQNAIPERALRYAFEKKVLFLENLVGVDGATRAVCEILFEMQEQELREAWRDIDRDKIPELVKL